MSSWPGETVGAGRVDSSGYRQPTCLMSQWCLWNWILVDRRNGEGLDIDGAYANRLSTVETSWTLERLCVE